MYLISFNLYCIFNHKKFSYPAAYNQSTIQRKSAGTLLFGFRYDHQKLEFDYTKLPPTLTQQTPLFEQLKIANRTYSNYSISAGYAYNWAFARNCLLAGSFTPTIGLSLERGRKVAGTKPDAQAANLNLGFVGRVALFGIQDEDSSESPILASCTTIGVKVLRPSILSISSIPTRVFISANSSALSLS